MVNFQIFQKKIYKLLLQHIKFYSIFCKIVGNIICQRRQKNKNEKEKIQSFAYQSEDKKQIEEGKNQKEEKVNLITRKTSEKL